MKRVHVSWHVAAFSVGIIVGTALCVWLVGVFVGVQWLIVSLSLFAIALIKRGRRLIILSLCAGLLLGLWRGTILREQLEDYQPYYGHSVMVRGKVSQDASYGPKGDQRLRLSSVQIGQQQLAGEMWISMAGKNDIKRGDYVVIAGDLKEGFGTLSATIYRTQLITLEHPHPGDIGRQTRDHFATGVQKAIPEPEVSLGLGYLVGQRSTLPETLEQQIRIVGLTHVIVASGYNLTILVSFARRLFAKLSKYLATLVSGFMIFGFMLITGFSPSMSRAGLVAGLGLAAWYFGRKMHPLVLLPLAAAITLLIRPSYVWGDIGWYLSFVAFVGVIVLAPLLHHYFWGIDKKPHVLRHLIVDTISAQALTMPIILFSFGQYSAYALLANVLVLPLVPFAMLFTFFAGVVGLIAPTLGHIAGLPATVLLKCNTYVIEHVAKLPGAQGEITFSKLMLGLSYVVIVLAMVFLWRQTQHNFRGDSDLVNN